MMRLHSDVGISARIHVTSIPVPLPLSFSASHSVPLRPHPVFYLSPTLSPTLSPALPPPPSVPHVLVTRRRHTNKLPTYLYRSTSASVSTSSGDISRRCDCHIGSVHSPPIYCSPGRMLVDEIRRCYTDSVDGRQEPPSVVLIAPVADCGRLLVVVLAVLWLRGRGSYGGRGGERGRVVVKLGR